MDENLKRIKNMLLNDAKKIFPSELNGIEATTLSKIYEEINKRSEDDSDIRAFVEYLLNIKYFKDKNRYYSFESYNKRMIRFKVIELNNYHDEDEEEDEEELISWYSQKTVTYSEGCRKYINTEDELKRFKSLKPISADEYNMVFLKFKHINHIKDNIKLKENKIRESIKRVKLLGTSLRLCDYTKNMTQEEYLRLANLIDEETRKDIKEYLNYLNDTYSGKYVYFNEADTLKIHKVDCFEFIDQAIRLRSNEAYSISSNSAYKELYSDTCERVELIIDIVDENIIKEIDNLIESFF